jgi:hypothetical protein
VGSVVKAAYTHPSATCCWPAIFWQ